jgi:hypothetical protein
MRLHVFLKWQRQQRGAHLQVTRRTGDKKPVSSSSGGKALWNIPIAIAWGMGWLFNDLKEN